jgi:Uncharacterized protein conserved in bacteria
MEYKYHLTQKQARQFILRKQGLLGKHRYAGKEGILSFLDSAGCVQFDPIDVYGKNSELVLQSRIKNFRKQDLFDLLYKERSLVDFFDKQLSIFKTSDWIYFHKNREISCNTPKQENIKAAYEDIRAFIEKNGPSCSGDIKLGKSINGYWGRTTTLSRAALEELYFQGELIIHHKKGTKKYYDFTSRHIPKALLCAENPFLSDIDYFKWNIRRRISSVGLLWNAPSDAFLGISGLKANVRNEAYAALTAENLIIPIEVDNFSAPFYLIREDIPLLEEVLSAEKFAPRCEFIAPLDNFIWDRKLIQALFDFSYKWEIYTPAAQRKYGYYILPILFGENFVGRIEFQCDKKTKTLSIKNIWFESHTRKTKKLHEALDKALIRFAKFNDCTFEKS